MKNFKTLLNELKTSKPKEAVFTFGRFQGLTIGHQKLLDSLFSQDGDHFVFISQTNDDQKNPLSPEFKQKILKSIYPEHKKSFSIEFRTPIEALDSLIEKGYTKIKMIVGQDRVDSFKSAFDGRDFPVSIQSAGDRTESGDAAEQATGETLRDLARAGALKDFNNLAHSAMSADQKIEMFNEIRKAYGKDKVKVSTAEKIREEYVAGKIFNVGDYVSDDKGSYKILERCSNYVRVVNPDGKVSRKWLTDIEAKREVSRTFAEAFKTSSKPTEFSVNGYTPRFPSKLPVKAFAASVDHPDQYGLLEAIKETEKMFNTFDLKKRYQSFVRSGEFLEKLGLIESHKYRAEFESQLAMDLIDNVKEVGTIFDHNKEKIVEFFADLVGVNKNLTVESTVQRCVNKINNTILSETQKKLYVDLIDLLIEEGIEFDFYSLNFIRECKVEEGSDRDLLLFADQLIECMTFEDIVPLYEESDFVIITEAFGKKSVKVEQPLDDRKIQRKAKQIAVQYMKQRKSRKAVDQLTTAEKKKIEEIVGQKGSVLTMISRKLGKKIKKIEAERLIEPEETQSVEVVKETPIMSNLSPKGWEKWRLGTSKYFEQVTTNVDPIEIFPGGYFYDCDVDVKAYCTMDKSGSLASMSIIDGGVQIAASKGSDPNSSNIVKFMQHYVQHYGTLSSDNTQSEGSKRMWLNIIKSNLPKVEVYVVFNLGDGKAKEIKATEISPENLSLAWGSNKTHEEIHFEMRKA